LVYCPYIDKDLPPGQTNSDHIVSLALGGMNGIEVPACSAFNSHVGSKIEGALANDFLVLTNRDKYEVKGHSGKEPVFVVRHSSDPNTGRPLQVSLVKGRGSNSGLHKRKDISPMLAQ